MTDAQKCEACGNSMPPHTGTRPRRFCSSACRSRASRARRLGTGSVPAVDAERAVATVLESPEATRQLLVQLNENISSGRCSGVEYNGVISAVLDLRKTITSVVMRANR